MRLGLFLYFFIVYAVESSAQNISYQLHSIDTALEECQMLSENQSTEDQIECQYNARIAWDREMTKYYKLLLDALKPAEKKFLKEAQGNWLQYRDSEMSFAGTLYKNMEGASWFVIHAKRLTEIAKQRALELEEYYEMATFDRD